MLAHRVGQYYGLQTSTVDYEESQGRVLGIRTAHCHVPKVSWMRAKASAPTWAARLMTMPPTNAKPSLLDLVTCSRGCAKWICEQRPWRSGTVRV